MKKSTEELAEIARRLPTTHKLASAIRLLDDGSEGAARIAKALVALALLEIERDLLHGGEK